MDSTYLMPPGFLGTGASLLADLTLLAYILLIVPGMIVGFVFARRRKFRPHHKRTMMTLTAINWILIIFLMIVAYRFDVAGNIGQKPGNARYLVPTIHGILGLIAQLLGSYAIYRMLREERQVAAAKQRGEPKEQLSRYYFTSAKYVMRTTLALWLITSLLGIFNYVVRYDVIPAFGSGPAADSVATEEPAATQEAVAPQPVATEDANTQAEPAATLEVMATQEPEPVQTPEATP